MCCCVFPIFKVGIENYAEKHDAPPGCSIMTYDGLKMAKCIKVLFLFRNPDWFTLGLLTCNMVCVEKKDHQHYTSCKTGTLGMDQVRKCSSHLNFELFNG